jgi:hypothetical protein
LIFLNDPQIGASQSEAEVYPQEEDNIHVIGDNPYVMHKDPVPL